MQYQTFPSSSGIPFSCLVYIPTGDLGFFIVNNMEAPAFQFYASDFMGSTGEWTDEEVGRYLRLLCHEWMNGSISVNPVRHVNGGTSPEIWAVIKIKFIDDGNGRLINKRLEETRQKQTAYKQRQSNAGKKSAAARKSTTVVTEQATGKQPPLQPNDQPELNSSSSSSSLSSSDKDSSMSEALLPFYLMAIEFHDIQTKNFPKQTIFKKSLRGKADRTGAATLEQLHRIDGWTMDEIAAMLKWIPSDDFWSAQIRSLGNIRNLSKNGSKKIENAQVSMLQEKPVQSSLDGDVKAKAEIAKTTAMIEGYKETENDGGNA